VRVTLGAEKKESDCQGSNAIDAQDPDKIVNGGGKGLVESEEKPKKGGIIKEENSDIKKARAERDHSSEEAGL